MTDSTLPTNDSEPTTADESTAIQPENSATPDEPDTATQVLDDVATDEPETADQPTSVLSELEDAAFAAVATVDQGDDAFAVSFRYPTSLETSPDGRWLVWLQPNETNQLELWLSETSDGAEPFRLDLPFVPVEDRDPESGRLLRGPQFSPDSGRLAITGLHPDGSHMAIWIVPMTGGDLLAEEIVGEDAGSENPALETDTEEVTIEATDAPSFAEEMDAETAAQLSVADDEGMIPVFIEEETVDAVEAELPLAGPKPFLLVDHVEADRSPRWSPDGEIIAFTSTVDGRDVIALASPSAPGEMEMLTWSRVPSREPMWSRDGKFIAFLRPIAGGSEYHDIWSFSLEAGELTNLTGEKAANVRHSIEWVPGRNLIAFVTIENGWLGISVVNADNKAGWVVTRETGDKTEPRFAPDEARLLYTRTEGFTRVLCERSLHSSAATALDPGEGEVSMARWSAAKKLVYFFSAPQQPGVIFVQENSSKAERISIQPQLGGSVRGMDIIQPQPFEFKVGPEETFSGLLYRSERAHGTPAVVFLPDGPLATRRGAFHPEEQALASGGLTVLSPVLHGATGFGADIENDLREFATTELETTDIAAAATALGKEPGIVAEKIAVVGEGYGGALALAVAGARPGSFGAVVAIDPVVDWTMELATSDVPWRNWVSDHFGMPLTNADTYAIRTPATFNAVIDIPTILVQTANASEGRVAQFQLLTNDLDQLGVTYTVMSAPAEPLTATLRRVSQRLAETFADGLELERTEHELDPSDV